MISETFNEIFEVSPNFPLITPVLRVMGFLDVAVILDAIDAKLFSDVQLHCPQLESCFTDMHKLIRMATQMVETACKPCTMTCVKRFI